MAERFLHHMQRVALLNSSPRTCVACLVQRGHCVKKACEQHQRRTPTYGKPLPTAHPTTTVAHIEYTGWCQPLKQGRECIPRTRAVSTSSYQVLVTLQRIEPANWRRLLVPSDLRVGKLHRVLQCVFDWENYHLHQFVVGDTFYGVPDPEWGDSVPMIDERTVPLSRVLTQVGDTMVYEYDFGDSWRHEVLLKVILPAHADRTYPLCVAGARARPPEDVGGVGAMLPFSKRYAIQCMQNTTSC